MGSQYGCDLSRYLYFLSYLLIEKLHLIEKLYLYVIGIANLAYDS